MRTTRVPGGPAVRTAGRRRATRRGPGGLQNATGQRARMVDHPPYANCSVRCFGRPAAEFRKTYLSRFNAANRP